MTRQMAWEIKGFRGCLGLYITCCIRNLYYFNITQSLKTIYSPKTDENSVFSLTLYYLYN